MNFLFLAVYSPTWIRWGEGQAGPGVPPEQHQPGDEGDLSRAVQRLQGGFAPGVHHEGASGQEDGQTERCKENIMSNNLL